MRFILALMTMVLAAAMPGQAAAHFDYYWRHELVRLTPVQAERVAELVRRLTAPGLRAAPPELARAVALHGDCALAERLLLLPLPAPLPSTAVYFNLYPAVSGPDRACAERVIARIEATPGGLGRPGLEPSILYQAGSLWRRIGEEEKARAAIDRAELMYDAWEAEHPDDVWSCHGGHCLSSRWYARLEGLRLLHATPMWRAELRRLAGLAAAGLEIGGREPEVRVGQRVFETLVQEAATHDEEAVGLSLVAGTPYGDARAYHAARMHALLAEGKVAEAIALLPRAGRAFDGGDPRVIAAHFEAFAAVPGFYERFGLHRFNEASMEIVRALMERGDFEHAAVVVAAARGSVAGAGFRPLGYAAMEGLAAFLDDPRAPVARLVATRVGRRSRESELAELALFQASRGDWRGFEAAFAEVRHDSVRARVRAELPCRAASAGEAAAFRGIRRAGTLRPGRDTEDERLGWRGYVYQSFLCLLRRGHGDAAIAYAQAIGPVRLKLDIASGLPIWTTLAEPARIRRRLADLALAHAERHDLWQESAIEPLALDYERLGDYRQADRIVARVPDAEERGRLLVRLIESYMPEPER
ncbi:MAG TPA: hypothetical protein VEW25_01135 [Allosphingosinicella sp.]|nr:hypothetical protein [Allosphingosinicella sp.]